MFGSRARDDATSQSDVDIGLVPQKFYTVTEAGEGSRVSRSPGRRRCCRPRPLR
ncbi:MAG: nucleotidyltransferase domain-containing protein [Deltaproteobacteria bacterium]|nr:nucleotidyltransferase domain-containing protein [Deltaproteobacteria bacterium]